MVDQLTTNRIAARLADALDLIVNCDAFSEPVIKESKRDPEAEEVRLQRIEYVLAAGRRAVAEYDAAIQAESSGWVAIPQPPMSGQTRLHSAIEATTNVVVGYVVALASQLLVFPMFGIHVPFSSNLVIGAWFTVISLVRSYVLRRWFNGLRLWS